MFVFVHVSYGVIETVKVGEDLETLKNSVITGLIERGFDLEDEEAEIRNDQNETVFNFNRYYTIWTLIQKHPFPFFNVQYTGEDEENYFFNGSIGDKEKTQVKIRVKTEIDCFGVYYKKEDEEEFFYENIYHV